MTFDQKPAVSDNLKRVKGHKKKWCNAIGNVQLDQKTCCFFLSSKINLLNIITYVVDNLTMVKRLKIKETAHVFSFECHHVFKNRWSIQYNMVIINEIYWVGGLNLKHVWMVCNAQPCKESLTNVFIKRKSGGIWDWTCWCNSIVLSGMASYKVNWEKTKKTIANHKNIYWIGKILKRYKLFSINPDWVVYFQLFSLGLSTNYQ